MSLPLPMPPLPMPPPIPAAQFFCRPVSYGLLCKGSNGQWYGIQRADYAALCAAIETSMTTRGGQ